MEPGGESRVTRWVGADAQDSGGCCWEPCDVGDSAAWLAF